MEHIGSIVDRVIAPLMASIKEDCLSKPFTNERSITVDQICFVEDQMRDGLSFIQAVKQLQQVRF